MEILTVEGFLPFDGVSYCGRKERLGIYFDDETFIILTPDHEVVTPDGKVPARELSFGDLVQRGDKTYKRILLIDEEEAGDVYDILEVPEIHTFLANHTNVSQCLLVDEFAHIKNTQAEAFFASAYPTIASGSRSKIILISTPRGMNHFYKMWVDAEEGRSHFVPYSITWRDVPGRDEKWREQEIANTSEEQFAQEQECVDGNTLITVRNKRTGIIEVLPIQELYDRVVRPGGMVSYGVTDEYEVLGPNGFVSFKGIQKVEKDGRCVIGGLECSPNHRIMVDEKWVAAKDLSEVISGKYVYYDLLGVDGSAYITNGITSHNCEFLGSSYTLISPTTIKSIAFEEPQMKTREGYHEYVAPVKGRSYVLVADVSHGIGIDDSAFQVLDVTEMPYDQVACFRSPEVDPLVYPEIIRDVAKRYNDAWVLVELNDIGKQVSDTLFFDLEYENLFTTIPKGFRGQVMSFTNSKKTLRGVRTTAGVKRVGCAAIKSIIENGQLKVRDFDTVKQMSNFVKHKDSYRAEEGEKDDLMMGLVLFGWLTRQEPFKDMTNTDFRKDLSAKREEMFEDDMVPILSQDGVPDASIEEAKEMYPEFFDRLPYDPVEGFS